MPSFPSSTFFRSPRSFHRLRSFHLTPPGAPAQSLANSKSLPVKNTKILSPIVAIPLRGSTITTLAVVVSLVLIFIISLAFVGAGMDEPYFKCLLDRTANISPGIVLLGENVDIDIDEPSVTIRWSILACGATFTLPNSTGLHGSSLCGLPIRRLHVYVDNDEKPVVTYDPSRVPSDRNTGSHQKIQKFMQFDSNHVLDVHEARMYPFDTYTLSITLRAFSFNETLPIRKLATIQTTSSFDIETVDTEGYSTLPFDTQEPGRLSVSRNIALRISRPGEARVITLLLFVASWVLAHVNVGLAIIARRLADAAFVFKLLIPASIILVLIPQIRNSMPDAPGLDGVLIGIFYVLVTATCDSSLARLSDAIGFFPQMIFAAFSVIILLLLFISRELDSVQLNKILHAPHVHQILPWSPTVPQSQRPPTPWPSTGAVDVEQGHMSQLSKPFREHRFFPPLQTAHRNPPLGSSNCNKFHRRGKAMSNIGEGDEGANWLSG